ncbi:MAG TPA: hypothetical protein VFW40_14450 [Capsulimonadaceae bacterium]|nr:hypothetical protein [Capsulimonadaceae bacterium]
MKLLAQALVLLPFKLDLCAVGSEVPPIEWQRDDLQFALRFPPSLTEGTCGKSIYPNGWAWWTGDRIAIDLVLPISESHNDLERIRRHILQEMNSVLRVFLNSCRSRFHRPEIHTVVVDPANLLLVLEHGDGRREALPDSPDTLSFRSLPDDPPLDQSVNEITLAALRQDLEESRLPSAGEQLALDAEWLHSLGEHDRADAIERLASDLSDAPSTKRGAVGRDV